jgi:hypothetical protein
MERRSTSKKRSWGEKEDCRRGKETKRGGGREKKNKGRKWDKKIIRRARKSKKIRRIWK